MKDIIERIFNTGNKALNQLKRATTRIHLEVLLFSIEHIRFYFGIDRFEK